MEKLYKVRLNRYLTAMQNEKPDMIPIRPFAAEFTAKYAGFTCQEVTHDFNIAFEAVRKCAADFDWDAVVGNMVYVWTGLTQAIGLKYYGIPGIDIPPDIGFQYVEPDEENAYMKADEYDQLIEDPTGFLYNVWLPRVSADIVKTGEPVTYRNNLALVKGGMAMLNYFNAFGTQNERLRTESGTVSAIAGILKAPFDIIADKLRGYIGLTMDMVKQPDKVLKACEALMPHLYHVALTSADSEKKVPVGFWMHRGCVPFVNPSQFESHFWPTLKPIIQELWKNGHQTLFYAEGDWNYHLDRFAELPDKSIVYHVDRGDIFEVYRKIGHKFCLSGGIPNFILGYRPPDEVREYCRKVIDGVARDGGYIMDASAIMQNDTREENLRAMTDFTREHGVYSSSTFILPDDNTNAGSSLKESEDSGFGMTEKQLSKVKPGMCIPWEEKIRELPEISGDAELVKKIWGEIDGLGNMFIWQCLLSF
ncbi:uroporphyrinogen decarboxylase family protein [candidate division KSB1 bacterium]